MTSARPTPINDDHGDQFPGALPPRTPSAARREGSEQRLVRMHSAYTEKVNSAVQANREDLAHELAELTFPEELSGLPLTGRRSSTRTPSVRPPGQAPTRLARMGRFTRRSLDRFDRYTVDVFNPGHPYHPDADRSDRSA